MGCNPSYLCLLIHVALRLIKSQSIWNSTKIIVIFFFKFICAFFDKCFTLANFIIVW